MIEAEFKKKQLEEDAQKQKQEEALKVYWGQLFDVYIESSKQLNKQVVYVACGALGLSVAFIKDIISLSDATNKGLLITAWILLVFVLIVNIFSHYFSSKAANIQIESLYNPTDMRAKRINKITRGFNAFSFLLLLSGLALLITFIGINI